MNKNLYELLINGNYFTHSIGKIHDPATIEKLRSILTLGAIYSKDSLRKNGILIEGRVSGHIRITKDSYVSLFDPSGANLERRMLSEGFSNFFPIDERDIILLVDSSIEYQKGAKRSDFDWHEIIVKDKVPIDFIFGMVIPNDPLVVNSVKEFLLDSNLEIPVYDFSGCEIDLVKRGF